MPQRNLLRVITRVLDDLDVPYSLEDEWVRFEWPYSGEAPTPVSVVVVGNFELLGEGILVYKTALDVELIDTKTVERLLPELWGLAVRMAEEHREEVSERLEQAAFVHETLDQVASDAIEGILQVVE